MSKDQVIAYWIEQASGTLHTILMGPADLSGRRGSLYEDEVRTKYAADADEIMVIPLSRTGNHFERGEVERLKTKALEMQRVIREDQDRVRRVME
jgi:hypothetical protein